MRKMKWRWLSAVLLLILTFSASQRSLAIEKSDGKFRIKNDLQGLANLTTFATGFNYRLLDDGAELTNAASVSVNTPVKVKTIEDGDRDYYMFFGGLKLNDTKHHFLTIKRLNIGSSVGRAIPGTLNDSVGFFPQVVAVSKDNDQAPAIGYSFSGAYTGSYGEISADNGGFDFAQVDESGLVLNHTHFTGAPNDNQASQRRFSTIEEMYVNHQTSEIWAYGYMTMEQWGIDKKVYLRMHGRSINEQGRVRFSMRVYNPESAKLIVKPTFGVHMDIAGLHQSSAVTSLGEKTGIQFKHDASNLTEKQFADALDNIPYYLNFYRSNYPQNGNGPSGFEFNNLAAWTVPYLFKKKTNVNAFVSTPDIPKGDNYLDHYYPGASTKHPGWMYTYDQLEIGGKQVSQDVDLDIAVKDTAPEIEPIGQLVTVRYLDSRTEKDISKSKTSTVKDGDRYSETPILLEGYEFVRDSGNISGIVKDGESVEIIFYYEKTGTLPETNKYIELVQTVAKKDGSRADEVRPGERLVYQLQGTTKSGAISASQYFKRFTLNTVTDPRLVDVSQITFETSYGITIGTVSYDKTTGKMTAVYDEKLELPSDYPVILTFEATVSESASHGEVIKQKGDVEVTYTGPPIVNTGSVESNQVKSLVKAGELVLESAPDLMDFGQLKVSLKDQESAVKKVLAPLMVKDTRGGNRNWSMSAKMIKLLTNEKGTLPDALYYHRNGQDQLMDLTTSALVYQKAVNSAESVDISAEWSEADHYPLLKVRGGTALLGVYQGTVQWTLQDIPVLD